MPIVITAGTTASLSSLGINRDQIINAALRLQGYLSEGENATTTKITTMAEALNLWLKQLSAVNGLKLWTNEELVLNAPTLAAGVNKYTLGPLGTFPNNRPLRIVDCFIRNIAAQTDVSLQRLSLQEFRMLGNKGSTGVPNSFAYDPQFPSGVLYLYVTPDANSSAGYEIHIFSQRQILNMPNGTDAFDLPDPWINFMKWGLADQTALENQIPEERADRIATRAEMYRRQLEDQDVEEASIYFQPDTMRMGFSR